MAEAGDFLDFLKEIVGLGPKVARGAHGSLGAERKRFFLGY